MDTVLGLLKDVLGSNAFIGGVVCVFVILAVWWARGIKEKVSKVSDHEQHMGEFRDAVAKINTLPCSNHGNNIARHDEEHLNMESRMSKVETSMEYLHRSVETLTKSFQGGPRLILDKYTESHSPLSISEEGRKMMERLGMQAMFDENWERIKALIDEGVNDKNPYDIDQFCQEQSVVFPEKFLKKEQVDVLKADAYKEGLSLASYMKVIAVMSREKYFEVYQISPDLMPDS